MLCYCTMRMLQVWRTFCNRVQLLWGRFSRPSGFRGIPERIRNRCFRRLRQTNTPLRCSSSGRMNTSYLHRSLAAYASFRCPFPGIAFQQGLPPFRCKRGHKFDNIPSHLQILCSASQFRSFCDFRHLFCSLLCFRLFRLRIPC